MLLYRCKEMMMDLATKMMVMNIYAVLGAIFLLSVTLWAAKKGRF